MPSLIVVAGQSRGFFFKLEPKVHVVGRDESCDIQIIDERVSRRHLDLRPEDGGGFSAVDAESANGVFMAGQRIRRTRLRDGDVLEIGESKLLYTDREFADRDAALDYFKRLGERDRETMIAPKGIAPKGIAPKGIAPKGIAPKEE